MKSVIPSALVFSAYIIVEYYNSRAAVSIMVGDRQTGLKADAGNIYSGSLLLCHKIQSVVDVELGSVKIMLTGNKQSFCRVG